MATTRGFLPKGATPPRAKGGHDAGIAAEAVDHAADEGGPGRDVALLLGARVVAELELDLEAGLRVAVGQLLEVLHPLLAVRPEEAVQAEDERDARVRPQLPQRLDLLRRVLGHARRLRPAAELAGLGAGRDAEAEGGRAWLLCDVLGRE